MKGFRIAAALVLVMLIGLLVVPSLAENTSKNPLAIDMLVVIENSHEMKKPDDKNTLDPQGLRFEAAAALIWMCDTKYSRANYFLFDENLYTYDEDAGQGKGNVKEIEPNNIDIYDISVSTNNNMRSRLIEELVGKNTKINSGWGTHLGVDIGKALSAAVDAQLLPQNNSGNRKVIVLISSGRISKKIREESRRQAIEAMEKAKQNGIDIYTVCLKDTSARDLMQTLATKRSNFQIARDAENLAEIFRLFFADMIGSSSQNTLKPELVEGTKDTYEVMIPILNRSVLETNIFIPVYRDKNGVTIVDADSIEVLYGDKVQEAPKVTSTSREFGNFAMIKILEPDETETGRWKLRFRSKSDPSSIPFYMLYNYDITLKATAKIGGESNNTAYKSDRIVLESYFVDREGMPSDDSSLYTDHSGEEKYEDWMTIRGSWELYRRGSDGELTGDPVRKGEMKSDWVRKVFDSGEINLMEGNSVPSGDYQLVIYATGAGLDRRVELPLRLENHPPVAGSNTKKRITVNKTSGDPEKKTWVAQTDVFRKANEIVKDADGDRIEFRLTPKDGVDQAATMSLDPDGTIRYTTRVENGKVVGGKAVYQLFYDDGDSRGSGSVEITLEITSDVDVTLDTYVPELTAEGSHPKGNNPDQFLKNSAVVLKVRLKDQNGYTGREIIEKFASESEVIIRDEKGESVARGQFTVSESGDELLFEVENTGNQSATWQVEAIIGPFDPLQMTLQIVNDHAPEAVPSEAIEIATGEERIPGLLRPVAGSDTAKDSEIRRFSVKDLFTDPDGDKLIYSSPVFLETEKDEQMPSGIIWVEPEGVEGSLEKQPEEYTICVSGESTSPFQYTIKTRMVVTATDGDGKTGTYTLQITILDLYSRLMNRLILAAAAIVILVILILIIHQIRKPKFPPLNMTIREEPSLYDSGSETLSPVKKPTNANAVGVDGDMAAKHSISMELLQNIIIRPVRSRSAVGVSCRKLIGGHEVALEEERLKPKKQYTWRIGQELTVRNMNGEGYISIKLEDRSMDQEPDVMGEFGGDDEWTSAESASQTSSAGKKRGRKISRRPEPAQEEAPQSSTDGFDF